MGTTNFLQHNPGIANQENDSQYSVDPIRTGGIGVDNIMPSVWMNKVWYQCTTFVAAFAQMMANKGYNMSDASITALTAALTNVVTNADQKLPLKTIPFSPTPTFDASQTNGFLFTLAGNVTSATLINLQFGQIITFCIQNENAAWNFPWPSNVETNVPTAYDPLLPGSVQIYQFIVLADLNAYLIPSQLQRVIANITALQAQGTSLQSQITNLVNAFNGSLTTPGQFQFEGGLIIKWGLSAQFNTSGSVTYGTPFPNATLFVGATGYIDGQSNRQWRTGTWTAAGFVIQNDGLGTASWFAIGY